MSLVRIALVVSSLSLAGCHGGASFEPSALGGGASDGFTQAAVVLGTLQPGDTIDVDSKPEWVNDLPANSGTGEACSAPEAWRCAYSVRWQTAVSQVCRSGEWLNYHLSPQDCSGCAAGNQAGCSQNPNAVNAGYEVNLAAGAQLNATLHSSTDAVAVFYGPKKDNSWDAAEPIAWVSAADATLGAPAEESGTYLVLIRRASSASLPADYQLSIDCDGEPCADVATFDVGFVRDDDSVPVRSAPSSDADVLRELAYSETNLRPTGQTTGAGDTVWVELGGGGWVDRRHLVEAVDAGQTCEALGHPGRAEAQLLARLEGALQSRDGQAMAALVSPIHGLSVAFAAYSTPNHYDPGQVASIFSDDTVRHWTVEADDSVVEGSFADVMAPRTDGVITAADSVELHCDDVADVMNSMLRVWSSEFDALTHVSYFKPGSAEYAGLDWKSWQVGIEYVGGAPYVAAMTFTQWEP